MRADRTYQCNKCDTKIEIAAAGYVCLSICVWLIVSTGLIWTFLIKDPYPDMFSYGIIGLVVVVGGLVNLMDLIKHLTHPLVDTAAAGETASQAAPPRPFVSRVMDLGFFTTPLVVLVAAMAVLCIAGFIGSITDYVL